MLDSPAKTHDHDDMTIIETANDDELARKGTDFLAELMKKAIDSRGFTIVGLSGGSTPKPIYEELGKRQDIDWARVWIFLVDDRYCNADSGKSNQFLLRMTLLKNAPIPESQLLFPKTDLDLRDCVHEYDAVITDMLKKGEPDAVTLGMGDDGHIASLFPVLDEDAFGPKNVVHNITDTFDIRDRISVTFPVLSSAREAVFFLKGKAKKEVWEEMERSTEDERRWPAKEILSTVKTTVIAQW